MNLDRLKFKIKENPRLGCVLTIIKNLGNEDNCKKIIQAINSPYMINVNVTDAEETGKWIYYINMDYDYRYNGFSSLVKTLLQLLAYSDFFGFCPVVRIGPNSMYYDESAGLGDNVFEYFFKTVSHIGVTDINRYMKVTRSKPYDATLFGKMGSYEIPDEQEIDFLAKIFKKYMKLNDRVKETIEFELNEAANGGKTLGVHVRATDFNQGYNRHPVAVSPAEYLDIAKKAFTERKYEKIFLATDDQRVVNLFQDCFGDKLEFYKNTYRSVDGNAIHYGNYMVEREHHKYLLGLEIIKDFYTLGMCDGLIAGNSNVSICARIVKRAREEKYDYIEIIDKGIHHNLKEVRSPFHNMLKKKL